MINLSKETKSYFEFDNTLNVFGMNEFKQELMRDYINNKVLLKKCRDEITYYLGSMIDDDCSCWHNEYGRIDADDDLEVKTHNYRSTSEFCIELYYINNVIYYKVLPKNLSIDKNKIIKYDGYFLDKDQTSNLPKKSLDQLCNFTTDEILCFDMNDQLVDKRIAMYFS